MQNRISRLSTLCTVFLASQLSLSALAQESIVTVMTSYPQELINRYEAAFETANPTIDMRVEWRRSDDAWQLLQSSPTPGVDVYWAPSIDTFAAMASAGYFAELDLPRPGLPGRIGELLIDDPAGQYAAFEVAGFGFAYSQAYLDSKKLELPQDWGDLTSAEYAGSILMPVPSRQGFSPMIYESILQSSGWDAGWTLISNIAANSELMGEGGMSFIDDLVGAHHGLALTIDFFPKSAQMNGAPVEFRYADTSLFSPAHVAILKAAPDAAAAQVFLDFVLSDTGQALLLNRDVARLPVRPSAYTDSSIYNPFTGAITVPPYDFDLTGARKILLSAMFDVQVTDRHADLLAATTLLRQAASLAVNQSEANELARAGTLLSAPPINAQQAESLLADLVEKMGSDDWTATSALEVPVMLPVEAWTQTLSARMEEATEIITAIVAAHE
jgi:ABC-type Fe3+ transport system substrate-binding protein